MFDCIAYLVEHRGRAIGRDELIAAVWDRTDVADVQLSYLMRKVRRTLGDSGDGQNVILTNVACADASAPRFRLTA